MKQQIAENLAGCGITLNGSAAWDIQVLDERWYARIAHEGSLGHHYDTTLMAWYHYRAAAT